MRKIIYILLFLLSYTVYSQSLSVFNVDASNFPTIKASFFAFDVAGNQITNLNPSDFEVNENGISRLVTDVSCPEQTPPKQLSIVFAVDVTIWNDINNAKSVLLAWLDMIKLGKNEVAIMSYDGYSYINQDFTINREKLASAINSLQTLSSSEDHTGALIRPNTGAISVSKKARYKPIVILLSSCSHFNEERKSDIIAEAKKNNTSVNFVIFDRYDATPQICRDIASATGGFSNNKIPYNDLAKAKASINNILATAQSGGPCQIDWQSSVSCVSALTNVEVKLIPNDLTSIASYQSPNSSVAKLEIIPSSIKFKNAIPGIKKDTTITVTARNTDFNVTDITSSNPAYTVTPTSFFLINGQSQNLTISYIPADSGYTYTKFTIEYDKCTTKFYASGGYPGKKAKIQTLKLIQPNGGEFLAVGNDTIFTWEGVLPEEKVQIEYSTDNGANWIPIAKNVTGLAYKWRVPNTPSNQCLARVTANLGYEFNCPDVKIGNQIWMGCNLDVDTYRNGDPIPEVTDSTEWANLKTGAWCYYNNDPAIGAIYGKLYNWYAVNDPRGLAPEGWHIPTDVEWTELADCLGGEAVAGSKLKTIGTVKNGDGLWCSPNSGATNESGFSALPGGYRYFDGVFLSNQGYFGCWWSSTEYDTTYIWYRCLSFSDSHLFSFYNSKGYGFSVRCIKD